MVVLANVCVYMKSPLEQFSRRRRHNQRCSAYVVRSETDVSTEDNRMKSSHKAAAGSIDFNCKIVNLGKARLANEMLCFFSKRDVMLFF